MPSEDVARHYFEAVAARDLDAVLALWAPGGVERIVGQREVTAPDGVRELQNELNGAFPDLTWEVLDVIGSAAYLDSGDVARQLGVLPPSPQTTTATTSTARSSIPAAARCCGG